VASLLELFSVLDKWGESNIGAPVLLQPDPALMAAREAIRRGTGMDEALAVLEEQINIARPTLRGLLYDVVEITEGNASLPILRNMLCDLHLSAARILMRMQKWEEARGHLLHAVACESGNPYPELTFVELYVLTGEYLSAIATLEHTVKGKGELAFSLFELASDLAGLGAMDEAKLCFKRVIETDELGIIAELGHIRLADLALTAPVTLSESQVEDLLHSGLQEMQRGDVQRSLNALFRVLSLYPREGRAWFFLGYILCVGAREPESFRERLRTTSIKLKDISVNADRYQELLQAEQALKFACSFNPDQVVAGVQLASCYLLLDRPDAVIKCAEWVFRQPPGYADAQSLSLLSQLLLGAGDIQRAAKAAYDALELESDNPVAFRTLSIIESVLQQDENEG
jgi:tetratricopeptide (TPR) repeat protein